MSAMLHHHEPPEGETALGMTEAQNQEILQNLNNNLTMQGYCMEESASFCKATLGSPTPLRVIFRLVTFTRVRKMKYSGTARSG